MRWLTWFDTLNLINVFNYYLILAFLVSTAIRLRSYWAILGLIVASRTRWPKLMELVQKHRTILLGWPTLLVIGMAFTLMLSNSLAIRLVWAHAEVTFGELRGIWLALVAVVLLGGLMVFLDCKAILRVGDFDRPALEKDLDRAESWLKSWMAPALRIATFGFINPRKLVGAEVHKAFVDANWVLIGGMHRYSIRVGIQLAFGLALWLTWAMALRGTA
jgi:hypothetical protein